MHSRIGPASVALVAFLASLSGCASLVGLDQITESACAPSCGDDGSAASDVVTAAADATDSADALTPQLGDGSSDTAAATRDQSAADSGMPDGTRADTGADVPEVTDAPEAAAQDQFVVDSAPDTVTSPEAGSCGTVYFTDSFVDTSKGWTLDSDWSITATCASPPAPQKGNPDPTVDHTTGGAGGVAAAFACGNNPSHAASAARYLTSPAVDVAGASSVFLTFYRWLNSDGSTYMASTVDVFDGTSWVNVYTNPSALVTDGAWTKQQFDVTAHRNASFKVRFGFAAPSSSVYAMSCWNVDDVTISSAACQ